MSQLPSNSNLDTCRARLALLALVLVLSLLVVSLLGSSAGPGLAIGALLLKAGASWPAAVYLVAAFGLGWPMTRLWRTHPNTPTNTPTDTTGAGAFQPPSDATTESPHAADAIPLQFAVGLACLFSLSHLLGIVGLLNPVTAIGVVLIGVGLALTQASIVLRARTPKNLAPPSLLWLLATPAIAVLLVAAAMPPGWLWASEFGGFDALSYHLQLPQEWLALGRIQPLEHNVYSYLPGYIEAAFAHMGAMTLAPADRGLLAGDGWRLLACQGLHAGLALAAAWLAARATRRFALNADTHTTTARWAGAITGCLMLATPWAVVTGSLAYNEAGLNAMLAGVLLVCAQPRMSPAVRGGLVGLLVGAACGFKPTALFFVGFPAGILLVASCVQFPRVTGSSLRTTDSEPRTSVRGSGEHEPTPGLKSGAQKNGTLFSLKLRTLAPALLVGALVGLLTLLPWLSRNFLHGGNPVFPFTADLFGSAHWSADQLARYTAAHTFDGSLADRLRTLLWTSPAASPDDPAVVRFRGLANPQWGVLLPMVVIAAGVLLTRWRKARSITILLTLGLFAQLLVWLSLTHLQSRFLLPMLPIAAVLVGLALARLHAQAQTRPDAHAAVALLAGLAVATQSAFLLITYTSQRAGSPGAALAVFPDFFTDRHADTPAQTATGWCNTRPLEAGLVLLVGDSTPLYFGPGVVYHTTYDTSPLGELMRTYPDDPEAWVQSLRNQGIGWLLVNTSELDRLHASGWYDPSVTSDTMRSLAETLGGPALVWPEERRFVVWLPQATSQPAEGTP